LFFMFGDVEDKLQEDFNTAFKKISKEEEKTLEEKNKAWKKYLKDRRDLINAEREISIEENENIKQSELQHKLELLKINRDYRKASLELDIESGDFSAEVMAIKNRQLLELDETYWRERQEMIDKNQEDFDNEIFSQNQRRLATARDVANEELELQKTIFATRIQEMKNAGASEQQIQRETLKYQILVLKTQIMIAKAFGDTTLSIQQMEAEIELINAQIAGIVDDEIVHDIEDNTRDMASAYKRLASEVVSYFEDIADAQVDNTERMVDDLNTRISETQRALETETQLYIDGYANNVTAKKKELAELEKARAEAIRERDEAIKRQQKLESLAQAIDLTSAAASVIKAYAGIPGVGLAIAAVVIGGLLTLFSSMKAKASSISQYGEGGVVDGNSHARGGVVIEAEGGEFVMRKSAYAKHPDLIRAINDDALPKINSTFINSIGNEKRGDVVIDTEIWNKMYNLWENNLGKGTTNVVGNKKIVTSGIRKRSIKLN